MKRYIWLALLAIISLVGTGCLDILGPSEEKVEYGPHKSRIILNNHEVKGDALVVEMLYNSVPNLDLQKVMVKVDSAVFYLHYKNTSNVDTVLIKDFASKESEPWQKEYVFTWDSDKNVFWIESLLWGNDKL